MDLVWKLKAAHRSAPDTWKTTDIGSEADLGLLLAKMLRWQQEGQLVRLEWSERN